jgi:hypothetical protein
MPGLGRIPEQKPQQQNYLLRSQFAPIELEADLPEKRYWDSVVNLNQGNTGTCVGHGFAHRMEDGPVKRPNQDIDPFDIYEMACLLDPWPENDAGDPQFGTSVDAGARACQRMGLISEFFWAWDMATAEAFVLTQGSLVIGVGWTESMFKPVYKEVQPGYWRWVIQVQGPVIGGHCLLLNGRNRELGTWRLKNSWGTEWGVMGQVSITDADLARLLADGGEFCWPKEVRP